MSARSVVNFFFCSSSPWSYLAFLRLQETAMRTGATIAYRPVIAAELPQKALAQRDPVANEAVVRYAAKDLRDWARFCGAPIAQQPPANVDETLAQRAILVANELGGARRFCEAVFRARHAEGRDIGNRALLLELATRCELPAADFAARIDAPDVAAEVSRNGLELQQRGGFTTPTMFAADEMFVGHDRMPLLEMALMRASERPFIAPGEHDRV